MRWAIPLLLAARAAMADPIANQVPASSTAYTATAPFGVAVYQQDPGWWNPPALWLCPMRGATFVCGTRQLVVVDGDRVAPDAKREAGLPHTTTGELEGVVMKALGSWPDAAWLVIQPDPKFCIHCTFAAYRWDKDKWTKVGEFDDSLRAAHVAAWRDSIIAIAADDAKEPAARNLRILGAKQQLATCLGIESIAATRDGTLVIAGKSCTTAGPAVQRWDRDGKAHAIEELGADPESLELRATSADDLDAFGHRYGDEKGVAWHFDGKAWRAVETPPKVYAVAAYARAPDGTEWIITETRDAPSLVWARAKTKGWTRIALTAIPAKLGRRPRPALLWIADGAIWVEATLEGDKCVGDQGCPNRTALLRTKGPTAHALRADVER